MDNDMEVRSPPASLQSFGLEELNSDQKYDADKLLSESPTPNNVVDMIQVHSRISEDLIPKIGMQFDSENEAYEFYKSYAKEAGFGIRKSKTHKDMNKNILDRIFCCCREGKRALDKRDVNVKAHRAETRCGCSAMIKINVRTTGKYVIENFNSQHNHILSKPQESHLYRSHRSITAAQIEEVEMANSCGISSKASFDLMSKQVGGRENLGFMREDYNNYLRTKRSIEMEKGGPAGILEHLHQRQLDDPQFFYAIQVDEDDKITNIFWADTRMVIDYGSFGDVVCFDTTYRSNKENRPFGMFVGVNHHKQTVIFGAALLYDESSLTFEWLFETFEKAMSEKKPLTILTDQHAGIAKALASKWPSTYHRLCVWHIFQNAAINLSHVYSRFKDFSKDFSACVFDYEEEEDFLKAWEAMIQKYGLEDNDWLNRMFNIKEKWALVYERGTFCASMSTTQRSESMNNVVKKYVSYKHHLREFFGRFHELLENLRYEVVKADHKTNQSTPFVPYEIDIMKHAADVYTHEVFKMFESEFEKAYDCKIEVSTAIEEETIFKVIPKGKHYHHLVKYKPSGCMVRCSCKKFEFSGILCSHALKVLSFNDIHRIPEQYILTRWTKKANKGAHKIDADYSMETDDFDDKEPKAMVGRRYKELCRLYTQLVTRAAISKKSYEIAKSALVNMIKEVDLSLEGETLDHLQQNVPAKTISLGVKVKGLKTKVGPKVKSGKRFKSCLEKAKPKKRKESEVSLQKNRDHNLEIGKEIDKEFSDQQKENAGSQSMPQHFQVLDPHVYNAMHNSDPEWLLSQPLLHLQRIPFTQLLGPYNSPTSYPLNNASNTMNLLQVQSSMSRNHANNVIDFNIPSCLGQNNGREDYSNK